MQIRISKRTVDGLAAIEKPFIAYDADLKGFAVRVAPSGSKTFLIEYRPGAGGRGVRSVRLSLGLHGVLTADEARRLAREKLAAARHGDDPATKRREARATLSLAQVAEMWMAEVVTPKFAAGTAALYRLYLDKHVLPVLGTTKVSRVTSADMDRLHAALGSSGRKATANRLSSMVSAIFNFAARRRLVPAGFENPVRGLERYREEKRERYLSTDELARLGSALREAETVGIPWRPDPTKSAKHLPAVEHRREILSPHVTGAIRLLLFTGCRLREILHLRWCEVDFERGMLFLPRTKTGARAVVLNAPALEVLATLPRAGEFVIAGADPTRPRSDLKRPWVQVCRAAEIDSLRIHDLRHSFASIGAGGALGLPIVGRLLGHTQAATTARYAHLDNDPLRRASDRIGSTIVAAMEAKPLAEVIRMARYRETG